MGLSPPAHSSIARRSTARPRLWKSLEQTVSVRPPLTLLPLPALAVARRSPPAEEREREGGRDETREERRARQQRDEIREERRRERERERRLEELNAHGGKRSKITRDRDRDISERVALGQANVGARTAEAMYDQRLFNQDQGLDSGFNADDSYNTYSKPLFADRSDVNLYRVRAGGRAGRPAAMPLRSPAQAVLLRAFQEA